MDRKSMKILNPIRIIRTRATAVGWPSAAVRYKACSHEYNFVGQEAPKSGKGQLQIHADTIRDRHG